MNNRYIVYHLRWQLSTLVMMAPMFLLADYMGLPSYVALPIVQFIGALIFWYIDGWIFTE